MPQPAAKDQDAINAALARVREKNATAAQPVAIVSGQKPDNSEAIAAREARKAEARARQAEKAQNAKPEADTDPRKAAVEAAIAVAKARKAGQQTVVVEQEATDPRKAAVEAAIARAKARKAAQLQPAEESEAPVDPRKAAVEAAIARAKARKAAQQDERLRPPTTIHAKPQSPPRLRVFRQRKPRSKPLTRIKWFSELQVPLTPITSARHRVL